MFTKIYRAYIEQLYTDRAYIFRSEHKKDPVTKETKLVEVLVSEDVPCRISQSSSAVPIRSDNADAVFYNVKMFISPEVSIKQGDYVDVSRGGTIRRYVAGEPFVYETHQEVALQRKEWA